MVKKITMVLLAVLLCSAGFLAACGNNGKSSQSESASTASSTVSASSSSSSSASSITASASASTIASASASASKSTVASSSKSKSVSASTAATKKYYIAGSFNGYLVNDENFIMKLAAGSTTLYTITVELTAAKRDPTYDGHWYKVTEGNWTNSYGTDNYMLQPAPIKKDKNGSVIGMGSIWIDKNMTLTIMFDSVSKKVYDNADGKTLPTP